MQLELKIPVPVTQDVSFLTVSDKKLTEKGLVAVIMTDELFTKFKDLLSSQPQTVVISWS